MASHSREQQFAGFSFMLRYVIFAFSALPNANRVDSPHTYSSTPGHCISFLYSHHSSRATGYTRDGLEANHSAYWYTARFRLDIQSGPSLFITLVVLCVLSDRTRNAFFFLFREEKKSKKRMQQKKSSRPTEKERKTKKRCTMEVLRTEEIVDQSGARRPSKMSSQTLQRLVWCFLFWGYQLHRLLNPCVLPG